MLERLLDLQQGTELQARANLKRRDWECCGRQLDLGPKLAGGVRLAGRTAGRVDRGSELHEERSTQFVLKALGGQCDAVDEVGGLSTDDRSDRATERAAE